MRPISPESSPGPAKPGCGRRKVRCLGALAIVLLLGIGFRALLPTAIERGAAFASRHYLGLPARIDNVDISVLRGRILLEGVSLGAAPDDASPWKAAGNPPNIDPATALLHCDRLAISFSWKELLRKSLILPEVEIQAPSLRLLRTADGKIEPLRGAKPIAKSPPGDLPPSPAADPGSSAPWPVEILAFSLQHPNVVILDEASGQPLLEFSLESFQLDRLSVRDGSISLGAIGVQKPVLRLDRDLVLADSDAAPEAGSPPEKSGTDAAAAGYQIKTIEIAGAQFTWITRRGPLDVRLAFRASDISADEGHRFPIDLTLEIESARLHVAGEAGILPPAFDGTLSWSHLPFPPLLLASRPDLASWIRSANSSGDLRIHADLAGAKGPPAIQISGQASVENFAAEDPGQAEVSLRWKRLDVGINDVFLPLPSGPQPLPTMRLHFGQITLEEPVLRYTHPSQSVSSLLGMPAPDEAPAPTANPPPPTPAGSTASGFSVDAAIDGLHISGGDIEVRDTSVEPDAVSAIRNLEITAREMHFPDPSAASIQLQAMLPVSAWLSVDGSLQPGNVGAFTVSLNELDLPSFDPYAAAAGAKIRSGRLSLEMSLKTQGAAMQIENDAVLRQIGINLGNPASFSKLFGMPLDLAIALLSDPSGDIRLQVPVQVDDAGTNISLGPILSSAIKAALIGAVTTPLKLLGASLGGPSDGAGLMAAPLNSPPGSPDLAPDAPARIQGLAKLLAERPAMGVVLQGRTSAAEIPLVARKILIEGIQSGRGLPALDGVGFLGRHRMEKILAQPGGEESEKLADKDQALLEKYIAATTVPPARLDALAASRAEMARKLLIAHNIPASRIRIADREAPGDPGVVFRCVPQPLGSPDRNTKKKKNRAQP